jgi:DNA primase
MISQDTINNILQAADIVSVISDSVKLTKKGVNYTGLCPFHEEKTPSFMVSPAKGIYKCFGCGVAGGPVNFLMNYMLITYPEALRYLAAKFNVIIEETKQDPDHEIRQTEKEKLFTVNELALGYFKKFTGIKDPENKIALDYLQKRFTREQIVEFQLGFVPDQWDGLLKYLRGVGIKEEFILKSNLVKEGKNNTLFDFFRYRIIFPIFNSSGRVVAFGGRIIPDEKYSDQSKYLNSAESILYNKSEALYGLNKAIREITRAGYVNLVEGYTDVIRLHSIDVDNTVAPCGTALTPGQVKKIKRFTNSVILIYDGDKAGRLASDKNGKIALENGLNVYVAMLPEGEDPDTFFKSREQFDLFIKENKSDYIVRKSQALFSTAGNDPMLRHEAINDICNILSCIDKSKQNIYIEQISQICKIKPKLFNDKLVELDPEPSRIDTKIYLPENVDANEFEMWGFYAHNNEYYFRTKSDVERLSNFIMKPVFHIDSIYDSKRIYEMINVHGYRVVVNMDMNEMTSLQAFQRNIESKGNFMFWGTMAHFQKMKLRLYEETRTCQEIKVLGWQKEGFWAWSNGIIDQEGNFVEIDEYGIVEFYEQNYFIPAFSRIYIADKTIFLDERKFRYIKRDIKLNEWSNLFIRVFGDNAKIGIAYWIATIFRDHLLHTFKNFPILNLFGPKGTGKSQMAMSLCSLFGIQQTPFNIHNGTKAGLAEHIQQFCNAFAWIDEYKNSLEYDKIETLKSIYDAIGRSRMNMDKGKKKETTEVNSAVILSGQEMPTADVALFSRTIFLQFFQTEFSPEEKENYDTLKTMEHKGLSELSNIIIRYRKYFEENFFQNYQDVLSDFSRATEKTPVEDRILRSMCTVISAFKTITGRVQFPFTYEDIQPIALVAIRSQNSQISKSNEIGLFWNLLESMYDENQLIDGWHFKIEYCDKLTTKQKTIQFPPRYVLKFKFNAVSRLYAENIRKIGLKPLPLDTLRYYLENHRYFIGIEKSKIFTLKHRDPEGNFIEEKQITTAYCFDYDDNNLGINLIRDPIGAMDRDNGPEVNVAGVMKLQNGDMAVEAPGDELPF